MRILMIIIYFIMAVLVVAFAALNAGSSQINLYFTTLTMPIALWMLLCCLFGILIGFCLFLGRFLRLKRVVHKIKNELKLTEKEIKNLRAIPLQDQH